MTLKGHENVMAAPVVEASTETPHDLPHVTQPDTQQERREDPIHSSHDERPEAQLESESKSESESRAAEASHGEVPGRELRLHPPKPLLSTVASRRAGIIGNADNADGRQSQESPKKRNQPDSSEFEFEFQDAHVPLDVRLL
jgi:hypothetical protein